MKTLRMGIWIGLLLAATSAEFVRAMPVSNGEFTLGLQGWIYSPGASAASGVAQLDDSAGVASVSYIYQSFAIEGGNYSLAFDFSSGLSAYAKGTFPDTFYASIYFVDDPSTFNLQNPGSLQAQSLLSVDVNGAFNVAGQLESLGENWMRYSTSFTSLAPFAIVVFELDNLDLDPGDTVVVFDSLVNKSENLDSYVLLDNVWVEPELVPEPASMLLVALGLGLTVAVRRRRS